MKKTLSAIVALIALATVVGLFNVNTADAAKVIKFQSVYPETSFYADHLKIFAEKVNKYSGGDVKIKLYWPGQLVKSKEGWKALQRGMIEGLALGAFYGAGFMPEGNGGFLSLAWENDQEMVDIFLNHGFLEVMREAGAQHNMRYLVPLSAGSMGLLTKFPVRTLDDLKGKKIKSAGISAEFLKSLGVAPVSLSQTEQYMALQRGTIDGTHYPDYTLETYKLYEVVDYIIKPALQTPVPVAMWLNLKTWNGLSPANKEAVEKASIETMKEAAELGRKKDEDAWAFAEKHGVTLMKLPPDEVKRFRDAVMPFWEAHAKKSPLCAKQVEILKNYRK